MPLHQLYHLFQHQLLLHLQHLHLHQQRALGMQLSQALQGGILRPWEGLASVCGGVRLAGAVPSIPFAWKENRYG